MMSETIESLVVAGIGSVELIVVVGVGLVGGVVLAMAKWSANRSRGNIDS